MSTANNVYIEKLKELILLYSKNYPVKIFLFGSYATNKARRYSDVDIAILPQGVLPLNFLVDLQEKIEESTIPYKVDLVDLSQVEEPFRNKVITEGIVWKD